MEVSEMARMGGHARAKKMTKEQRSESARTAALARNKLSKKERSAIGKKAWETRKSHYH